MISLWRDPQGEKVFTTDVNTEIPTLGEKTKIAQLEQEILSLKQQLKNPNDVRNNHEYNYMIIMFSFHSAADTELIIIVIMTDQIKHLNIVISSLGHYNHLQLNYYFYVITHAVVLQCMNVVSCLSLSLIICSQSVL